jgi:hypothetical protein
VALRVDGVLLEAVPVGQVAEQRLPAVDLLEQLVTVGRVRDLLAGLRELYTYTIPLP